MNEKLHQLKIDPKYFKQVKCKDKTFELRKDDRNYQIGDYIVLQEWTKEKGYTGRTAGAYRINYILRNCPEYGLMDGYCIIGFY